MGRIVVFVNNEYLDDNRVRRSVSVLSRIFSLTTVCCGVPELNRPVREIAPDNVEILRHLFLKPTSSRSPILKGFLSFFAHDNGGFRPVPRSPAFTRDLLLRALRTFLCMGWFFWIILSNIYAATKYRSLSADAFYSNDFDTLPAAFLLARCKRAALIYDAHELYADILESFPAIYRILVRMVEGPLARRADAVVTVSDGVANMLQERYSLRRKPAVIHNCPYYQPPGTRKPVNPDRIRIIYHGYLLPGRNLDILVRGMRHVANGCLFIRGKGILERPLRSLVELLHLQDKVIFLEMVPSERLTARESEFDIGIVPVQGRNLNSYYCAPNKVYEYMMSGLAIAVGKGPELRRIVETYKNGVFYDATDETALARLINGLDEKTIAEMQRNSLIAARQVFNFEIEGEKLREIAEQFAGARGRTARDNA